MAIPWKRNPSELPNSREMAVKLLCNTEKRLKRNPELVSSYNGIIHSFLNKGYVTKLSGISDQWLLPHFPVLRADKSTTKVRIVFDAAAQRNGISLNHFIAAGPKLQRDLVYILLLFRKGSVALICDVAEMYLQVELAKRDKKYVRFLWRDMDQSRSPDVYRYEFNRVVFGLTSSSFLAQLVIQTHAKKHMKDFPRGAETILRSTYMDDRMDSVETVEAGISLYKNLSELDNSAGMHA